MHVVLHGPRSNRWAMTDRGVGALSATADALSIGRSAMHWDGAALRVDFDEITAPVPRRIRGSVRLWPQAVARDAYVLNANGHHQWRPISPRARVEVLCSSPDISWSGEGYFDCNRGDAPLETGFRDWIWSRAPVGDGAVVLYDGTRRDGTAFGLGLRFDSAGNAQALALPPVKVLPSTRWRMPRPVRSEGPARIVETLADAPFYARSAVATCVDGEEVIGVHEALSLDRFAMPIVQAMLPFRVPRRRGRLAAHTL